MSDIYKILRKLDPETLPQDMRGMGFSYKILPTRNNFRGKDLRGCVFYKCHPKLRNEGCLQIDAITDISQHTKTLDLQMAYLEGANLEDADLQGADLTGTDLTQANLEGANLEGANLEDADLKAASLQWAYLQGATLRRANLEGADLQGANLQGANLQGADLFWANLVDAIYDDTSKKYFSKEQLSVMRHISEVDDE